MFSRIKKILKREEGMLDLGSIMTGVVVTGILGAVIATSFVVVIPWFQDKTAQDDINIIKVAQDSHYSDKSVYGDEDTLLAARYLHKTLSTTACVSVLTAGADYNIYVTSKSGKIFKYNPADLKPAVVASIPVTTPVCK